MPLSPENQSNFLVVSQLLTSDKSRWDESKLYELFIEDSAKAIKRILVKVSQWEDNWLWLKSHNGKHSVKSTYKEILALSDPIEPDQGYAPSPFMDVINSEQLNDVIAT
ncbi:hypothetical protein SO802_021461 [Lithocarpus litseifolius]|uniref:Uncharacterized protein n=1 Tax=Lithocarpus litseifolius TaxID=425828 RepID=A0AAW2CIF4_9ROSI